MATGELKLTCCHPDALSLPNVALASNWPLAVHRLPTCVPVLLLDLKKRIPVISPSVSEKNLTPTSVALVSASVSLTGADVDGQIEQGQVRLVTVTAIGVDGAPRFAL